MPTTSGVLLRAQRAAPLVLCAVLLLLAGAVSGCGALRFGASPTSTPDAATILQRAGKASYRDATFTLTSSSSLMGSATTATGNGAITTSPARTHFIMSIPFDPSLFLPTPTPGAAPNPTPSATPGATQLTMEIITDAATNTSYMRFTGFPSIPGVPLGDGSWIKTTISGDVPAGGAVDVTAITGLTDLGKAKTARLIAVETLDGVHVYHLQSSVTTTTIMGTTTISSTTVTDYYVRQDNYRPVKFVANSSGGANLTSTVTLTFTAYDTGVTIDLLQV
jgi:hypothetical protein